MFFLLNAFPDPLRLKHSDFSRTTSSANFANCGQPRFGSHCSTHLTPSCPTATAASSFASPFCNSRNFEWPRAAAVLIVRGIGWPSPNLAGEAQKSRTRRQCVVIGNAIRLVTFDVIISFSREKVKTRARIAVHSKNRWLRNDCTAPGSETD